jgi:muramoyltetrapeptide carboxypeptidase
MPAPNGSFLVPPFLRKGDTVGLVAPSRGVEYDQIRAWVEWMERQGFEVEVGLSIGQFHHQLAGTDEERAADLQGFLNRPDIGALFMARGGYGAARILDLVNWSVLRQFPKWLCGYSDSTAILNHALAHTGVAGLHGPMPFQFNTTEWGTQSWELTLALLQGGFRQPGVPYIAFANQAEPLLTSEIPNDPARPTAPFFGWWTHKTSSKTVEGYLYGGNLSVVYSLLGSNSLPTHPDLLLLAEDIDEYRYHLDRMWLALRRSGHLDKVKAILLGDFTDIKDHAVPHGLEPIGIAYERTRDLGAPVLFGLPFGHGLRNFPLPLGVRVRINPQGLYLLGS